MITTCTTSPDATLATMADLLTVLGATASSCGHDKALVDASRWVETHITGEVGGTIRRQVYLETLAGRGSQNLMLSRTPVLKIGRLFNATDTGTATEYCSTDYRIENAAAGFLQMTSNIGFDWNAVVDWNLTYAPRGGNQVWRPWLCSYEAGYQLGCTSSTSNTWLTTTTGRTLPEDIERAVLLKAAEFWGDASGVGSLSVGPLSINYSSGGIDPVVELLAPYRRI